jgi:hypothetical protein
MEREDERGVAKRPDPNELDMPEWAELVLDDIEWRELLQRIALQGWRQRARQSAATRAGGSIGSAEIFGRGHSSHNDKVVRAPRWTGQIQAGRVGVSRIRRNLVQNKSDHQTWACPADGCDKTASFTRYK